MVETHALKEAGGNEASVKLDGKPKTWLLEDSGDADRHDTSSWRNKMHERNLGLCILDNEKELRQTAWAEHANME